MFLFGESNLNAAGGILLKPHSNIVKHRRKAQGNQNLCQPLFFCGKNFPASAALRLKKDRAFSTQNWIISF